MALEVLAVNGDSHMIGVTGDQAGAQAAMVAVVSPPSGLGIGLRESVLTHGGGYWEPAPAGAALPPGLPGDLEEQLRAAEQRRPARRGSRTAAVFAAVGEHAKVEKRAAAPCDLNHHQDPDYDPDQLGIPGGLTLMDVDPQLVNSDRARYQRPIVERRVQELLASAAGRVRAHVGLLAVRNSGRFWVVDGQHHTEAAVREGLSRMTYQTFESDGWKQEAAVYAAFAAWHATHHPAE